MRARWAHAALTTLMWAAVPMWVSCTGFYIWSLYDGPPECGTSMAYTAVLAFTGTMVFVVRHNSPAPGFSSPGGKPSNPGSASCVT